MRFLLAFLMLASVARGQADIRGDLIDAPETVEPGGFFWIDIKSDAPYTIEPMPEKLREWPPDANGVRLLLIRDAKSPGYKISISHQVVHPTPEEIETAPLGDKTAFLAWLRDHSSDEVYQDSHTITVGGGPTPGPDPPGPEPKPPADPIARKVYDSAMAIEGPRQKTAEVMAKIYRNVASRAAGLSSMTVANMAEDAKAQTKAALDLPTREKWGGTVGVAIDDLADEHAKDRESAIETYNKFAEGLEAVR